jgi:hypothetical protein
MRGTRRSFLKTASASAACAALWNSAPWLMADPLGLPLGLQLYSVRDILPKDYEGTLKQLSALGYREVEAAGFFDHTPAQVKLAMAQVGLHCVSAHYPMVQLQPHLDEIIQFGKDLGLDYVVCAAPGLKDASGVKAPARADRESMTLGDWRWNADFHAARKGFQDDRNNNSVERSAFNRVGPRHDRLPSYFRSSEEGAY